MMIYRAFASTAFQTRLVYRGQVWAQVLGELVTVFAKIAIWTSVFAGAAAVDGITLADMLTYAILGGSVFAAWQWGGMMTVVGEQIRSGDIAVFLLKPLNYPATLLAGEIGNIAFRMCFVVFPVVLIAALFYGLKPPASAFHGVMFILFWVLAFAILFLMALIGSILAFWMMTVFSLEWFLNALLAIFSGGFIPLWFFPESIAGIIRFLPFAWVGFHPMAVYLGRMNVGETGLLFAIGLLWVALLSVIATKLWQRAVLRIVVQGG